MPRQSTGSMRRASPSAPAKTHAVLVTPMAAHVVDVLPDGDEWVYEVKFDGYRALLIKNGERVEVRSRNDKDLSSTYPAVAAAARTLNARQATVDGELVAVDEW